MKRVFSFLFALVLLSGCASLHVSKKVLPSPKATYVAPVPDKAAQSIGRFTIVLEGGQPIGSCTAFSIAPRKFMTAAHCVPDHIEDMFGNSYRVKFKVDDQWANVVKVSEEMDLAVVVADEDKPALTFREALLAPYEHVMGIGFGYGFTTYLVTDNKVQRLNFIVMEGKEEKASYPGTLFMGGFIGGMSGGPIIDDGGLVVGVVQAGTEQIGYGVDVRTIHEFLDK